MDGIESIHIHNSTDYVGESRTIRWTEVFFIQNDDANNSRCEPVDLSRLAETLAQACCIALTPKLDKLKEAGLTKIGLRCTIDRDNVRDTFLDYPYKNFGKYLIYTILKALYINIQGIYFPNT